MNEALQANSGAIQCQMLIPRGKWPDMWAGAVPREFLRTAKQG